MPKGRPKGSGNKKPAAQAFVARIEAMLAKGGFEGGLEALACRFITEKKSPNAYPVWKALTEYKFGKPVQPQEHYGADGGPLVIQVKHILGTPPTAEAE